jgi:hypothetical protein
MLAGTSAWFRPTKPAHFVRIKVRLVLVFFRFFCFIFGFGDPRLATCV